MTKPCVLIGLSGKSGSGKGTVADHLCNNLGFQRHAFAEPLRDMLTALLTSANIDYAHLFERDLKRQPIPTLGVSALAMMETLGKEWGRRLHPDFWVRHAARVLGLDGEEAAPIHDRIVLTDVRFENEARFVRRLGGHIIRVERDRPDARYHISERDYIEPDITLDNSGPLELLPSMLACTLSTLAVRHAGYWTTR